MKLRAGRSVNPIRSAGRKPLTTAAVGVASAIMAGSAYGQGKPLPTIDVQAESVSGYQGTGTSQTRLPTPLLNTPQTVNVIPEQVLKDQNVSNVKDALRTVSGITFRAGEGGNQGDTPYIRGFSAQN